MREGFRNRLNSHKKPNSSHAIFDSNLIILRELGISDFDCHAVVQFPKSDRWELGWSLVGGCEGSVCLIDEPTILYELAPGYFGSAGR
jgi:hypothetical protein